MSRFNALYSYTETSNGCVHHANPQFESPWARKTATPLLVPSGFTTRSHMESPKSITARVGGPYPEEILLEAYNLEVRGVDP
jgi:hypothetical protein